MIPIDQLWARVDIPGPREARFSSPATALMCLQGRAVRRETSISAQSVFIAICDDIKTSQFTNISLPTPPFNFISASHYYYYFFRLHSCERACGVCRQATAPNRRSRNLPVVFRIPSRFQRASLICSSFLLTSRRAVTSHSLDSPCMHRK